MHGEHNFTSHFSLGNQAEAGWLSLWYKHGLSIWFGRLFLTAFPILQCHPLFEAALTHLLTRLGSSH